MNIRKLKIFYATAMSLNMTKVARDLYVSQPSVSQAIREVEQEVGVPLFDRIGKKIYLTNEGEIYLSYVRRILNLYEEAYVKIDQISNKKNGKIRIGASTTIGIYLLPDIMNQFIERNSGVEISLIIDNTSTIEGLILENKIDFAFIEGNVSSDEIIKEMIWKDEIIFICSHKHALSNKEIVQSEEIRNQKIILRDVGSGTRANVEAYLFEHEIEYHVYMELRDNEAVKKYVEAGIGIGCLSTLCVKEKSVHSFRLDKGKIERDLYLIVHRDKVINNNMKAFISSCNR